jgi:hypothetical protein
VKEMLIKVLKAKIKRLKAELTRQEELLVNLLKGKEEIK